MLSTRSAHAQQVWHKLRCCSCVSARQHMHRCSAQLQDVQYVTRRVLNARHTLCNDGTRSGAVVMSAPPTSPLPPLPLLPLTPSITLSLTPCALCPSLPRPHLEPSPSRQGTLLYSATRGSSSDWSQIICTASTPPGYTSLNSSSTNDCPGRKGEEKGGGKAH